MIVRSSDAVLTAWLAGANSRTTPNVNAMNGWPILFSRSRLHFVSRPVVCLLGCVAAPAIERIVKQEPGIQLREVVIEYSRQAKRGREQAGRFGRELKPCG